MSIGEALRYPTTGKDWKQTIVIGAFLKVFSFLIVPQLLIQGYAVRVMRRTLDGDETCPPGITEGDIGELMADGAKLLGLAIVYHAIPVVVFFSLAGGSLAALLGGEIVAGFLGLLTSAFVSLVLFAIFHYAFGAAAVNFVANDSLLAAFSADVLQVMISPAYISAKLTYFVIGFGVLLVKVVLAAIPLVHFVVPVLMPLVVKYANVAVPHLWTKAYLEAVDPAPRETQAEAAVETA